MNLRFNLLLFYYLNYFGIGLILNGLKNYLINVLKMLIIILTFKNLLLFLVKQINFLEKSFNKNIAF